MWKIKSAELHKWLKTTPPASHGAKEFLQIRYGVRSAVPFVCAHAFGLAFDDPEMICAPLFTERGADPLGWD